MFARCLGRASPVFRLVPRPRPALLHAHLSVSGPHVLHPERCGGAVQTPQLDFDNARATFGHKNTSELLRALFVLNACAIDPLVNHSYQLLMAGRRVLGERGLGLLVAPFYNQFVAGDNEEELGAVAARLARDNIHLMVAPMLETDLGEGHDPEELYNKNLSKTLHLVRHSRRHSLLHDAPPVCQTKLTAHLTADVLARVSTSYLNLSLEGRVAAVRAVAGLLGRAGDGGAWQPSDHARALQPLTLTPDDSLQLLHSLPRLHQIGYTCVEEQVVLAVDAEYTYTNPAISLLTLAMMVTFNAPAPLIWNTYQGYLKAGLENLREDLTIVGQLGAGVGFGAKLVRGAYLEKERWWAASHAYPDPVNDTYDDTHRVYSSMVDALLGEVAARALTRRAMVATHNEQSVVEAAAALARHNIDPASGQVVFGQVHGMADNVTLPLAQAGYLVFKSVPSGSVTEVLPYLSRRANENREVLRRGRRERRLLLRELLSRLSFAR